MGLLEPRTLLNERRVLEIAADRVEQVGYVVYDDFGELRPPNQTGNKFLFPVKQLLQDHGYRVHERRSRDDWNNCGYPGDHTHFHAN